MEEMNFMDQLKKNLAAEGLPMLEQLAEKVYGAVTKTALEYAAAQPNLIVKAMVPPAVKALDGIALPAIDKIDGQPG